MADGSDPRLVCKICIHVYVIQCYPSQHVVCGVEELAAWSMIVHYDGPPSIRARVNDHPH